MQSYKNITQLARELRRNQTPEEAKLWEVLRNRQFQGCKFLRQYPIICKTFNKKQMFFIADFYCASKKLIIELDGKIHDYQKEYDEQRDMILTAKGIRVLRINNSEIDNIEKILKKVSVALG